MPKSTCDLQTTIVSHQVVYEYDGETQFFTHLEVTKKQRVMIYTFVLNVSQYDTYNRKPILQCYGRGGRGISDSKFLFELRAQGVRLTLLSPPS